MTAPEIAFRPGTAADAEAVSVLICDSQREFCFHEYTEEGKTLMLDLCGVQAIAHYIKRGDVYFVATHEGSVIGVAGIRDNDHLAHNFVHSDWHRQGISNQLWKLASDECRKRGNPGSFNLRASTYAIAVYEKWGFVRTGPTDQDHGITSTPMALNP